jgi:DNA polymerase III epsilon subunit-like protein
MELTTNLCKLPFATRKTFGKKYKWPKLEEACIRLLGHKLEGAHDSLNDCIATGKLFRYLVEKNLVNMQVPFLEE